MKISFIVPFNYLQEFDEYSNFHLVLAQHIKENPGYTEFFMYNPKYKILDNGAYELGDSIPGEELIDKAFLVKANEIIIPDTFMECDKTIQRAENFLTLLNKEKLLGQFKLM